MKPVVYKIVIVSVPNKSCITVLTRTRKEGVFRLESINTRGQTYRKYMTAALTKEFIIGRIRLGWSVQYLDKEDKPIPHR